MSRFQPDRHHHRSSVARPLQSATSMSSSDISESDSHISSVDLTIAHNQGKPVESFNYDPRRQSLLSSVTAVSTTSSPSLFDTYFVGARRKFHDGKEPMLLLFPLKLILDLENMAEILDVELIENKDDDKERFPYKYRLSLPLNPPEHLKDQYKWESFLIEVWCIEDSENETFSVGLKTESEITPDAQNFFDTANKKQRASKLVDSFYIFLDELWYPRDKNTVQIFSRDFAYPVHNPMHFGHLPLLNTLANENYKAKVIYKFDTTMDGEMSIDVDEVVTILKNLGNGWLTAKKGNTEVGLIPENYVQRIT